jgi:nucleoside-diphosphate-sugar epimerase
MVKKGRPQYGKIKLRIEENLITYPNIKKATKFTGWKPKIKIDLGLKKTINYYRNLYS